MNLYSFEKVIYKGNVKRDFLLFCAKRNKKVYLHVLINFLLDFLSLFSFKVETIKFKNYYKFLNKMDNVDKLIEDFYKIYNKKINTKYAINKKDVIISNNPKILIEKFVNNKLIAYDFNENYVLDIKKYQDELQKITNEFENAYYNKFNQVGIFKSKKNYVYKKIMIPFKKTNVPWIIKLLIYVAVAALLSVGLTLISFTFTTVYLDKVMISSYLKDSLLLWLNYLPVLLTMLFFLFLTKRLWASFSITSLLVLILGIVNRTKLCYRDDVLKIEELTLFKEALIMTKRYDIVIRKNTILWIFLCIVFIAILKRTTRKINIKTRYTLVIAIIIGIMSFNIYKTTYTDVKIYNSIGNETIVNKWIGTRQSQIRGLIYPFIYSVTEITNIKPLDYSEENVKKILNNYKYENILENEKVNVIAIMLEAYNDFSKFDTIKFTKDVYKNLHDIESKSISGNLVVNIFGGGTQNTERHFLTGYYKLPTFRTKTYSYATYFKEQGYLTEAMHPIYGSFYNRNTVNINLGFDNYWNYENKYSLIYKDGFAKDSFFFNTILENLKKANEEGKPYFNFSVTYQNHGPYSDSSVDEIFIKNKNYTNSAYNMFNRYLSGISKTNDALKELVDNIENYNVPTILIVFGDHNPYLGGDNYVYKELGIDVSLENEESFLMYYETPYFIYANNEAKIKFNKNFKGDGKVISPDFLMSEVFDYVGWKGFEYNQYLANLKTNIDVIHNLYNKENNKFILSKDSNMKDIINEYSQVSYYWQNK